MSALPEGTCAVLTRADWNLRATEDARVVKELDATSASNMARTLYVAIDRLPGGEVVDHPSWLAISPEVDG